MRFVPTKQTRCLRHIRITSPAATSAPLAFSAPYLVTEVSIPKACNVASAADIIANGHQDGIPHNPVTGPNDPTNVSYVVNSFNALSLSDQQMTDHTPTTIPDCPSPEVEEIEIDDSFFQLQSDWTHKTVVNAFGVNESIMDRDSAQSAALLEKEICLRNIRRVARFHGFSLKEMVPETTAGPSHSGTVTVAPGDTLETEEHLDDIHFTDDFDPNDPELVSRQNDIAVFHQKFAKNFNGSNAKK